MKALANLESHGSNEAGRENWGSEGMLSTVPCAQVYGRV